MSGKLTAITMPKWGMSMSEGLLVDWLVEEGETVDRGAELLEIETEKITNVMEGPVGGRLCRRIVEAGQTVPVGALLGLIGDGDVTTAEIEEFIAGFEVIALDGDEDGSSIETSIIAVGGRDIRYLEQGLESDRPAVILIHGFGGDLNNWLFNQPALAEKHRVIALDLPGHGGSGKILESGSLEELATAVGSFMDALEINKAHLVGHSLGGAVALKLAMLHPGRVASLSLLAPAGLGSPVDQDYLDDFVAVTRQRKLRGVLGKLFASPELVTAEMVEDVIRFKRLDGVSESLSTIAENALATDKQAFSLGELVMPAQLIWGAADAIIAPLATSDLPLHVLQNSGHMVHMEAANEVNALIMAFLDS